MFIKNSISYFDEDLVIFKNFFIKSSTIDLQFLLALKKG